MQVLRHQFNIFAVVNLWINILEFKVFLDGIEKSGGNASVLVLQEILGVSIPILFRSIY